MKTLRHILDSAYGADIHPLAVITAKTNYILALGDLVKKRKGPITIPVYLADTIKLPERWSKKEKKGEDYKLDLDGELVHLPELLLKSPALYDQAVELAKEFAWQNRGKKNTIALEPFRNFLVAQRFPASADDDLAQALFAIAGTLKHFIDDERDTIWAFVLKNIFKPLFFKGKFDFIVGNPPWIAFRYLDPAYQAFIKRQITQNYGLLRGRGELITHLEIATLFLVRAADLYLKEGGSIAFVLPKSLFSADQHGALRQRAFIFSEDPMQNLFWRELWDCEQVEPLFNVPACVVVADKRETGAMKYPVPGQVLSVSERLKRKNASLAEAEKVLKVEEVQFTLHTRGKRSFWATGKEAAVQKASYYKTAFRQGATMVPRSFWFVQVKPSPVGFDPDLPPLETATRAVEEAKKAYQGVVFKDRVESRFLYATLLSTDLVPFGHLDYRLVVLPVEPQGDHYRLIDAGEAGKRGFLKLAHWLEQAEEEWKKRRSAKAKGITALDWLDYRGKLTGQDPQAKYQVLYPDINRVMLASVIRADKPIKLQVGQQELGVTAYVTDCKNYGLETDLSTEAYYICAVLNSAVADGLLGPLRRRQQRGHPDVHKKIFDVAFIPKFDPANKAHQRLAALGEECTAKVQGWLAKGGAGQVASIGRLRGMVRQTLQTELAEIDGLVHQVLKQ